MSSLLERVRAAGGSVTLSPAGEVVIKSCPRELVDLLRPRKAEIARILRMQAELIGVHSAWDWLQAIGYYRTLSLGAFAIAMLDELQGLIELEDYAAAREWHEASAPRLKRMLKEATDEPMLEGLTLLRTLGRIFPSGHAFYGDVGFALLASG